MEDISIDGRTFRIKSALDTFTQLHLARKLGPALPLVQGLVDPANADKDKSLLTVLMLSHISDEDSAYVMNKCLSVVMVAQGEKFVKLQAADGSLMFDDISLAVLLEITVTVIGENLGGFFRTALGNLATVKAQAGL